MNTAMNLGTVDRISRFVLAVVFSVVALVVGGVWSWIFYILAAVTLVTSITGVCLLYKLLGINTREAEHKS